MPHEPSQSFTTLVDPAQVTQARDSVRGDRARATAEHDDAVRTLTGILDELGSAEDNSLDFSRVTSIAGGAGEKVEKIIQLHSMIAGYSDALTEMTAVDNLRGNPPRVGNGGVAPPGDSR